METSAAAFTRPRTLPSLTPSSSLMGAGRTRPQPQQQQQQQQQQGAKGMGREEAKRARGGYGGSGDKFSAVGLADPSAASSSSTTTGSGARKPSATSSFVHIFFNRRPLELLKRTSSLLTGGSSSASKNSSGSSSSHSTHAGLSTSATSTSSAVTTAPVASAPEAERKTVSSSSLMFKREVSAPAPTTTSETRTSGGDATGIHRLQSLHQPNPTRVAPQTEVAHLKPPSHHHHPPTHHHHHHHPPPHHARWNRQRDSSSTPSPPPRVIPCARDILQNAPGELTEFEKREILVYGQVHFYSSLSVKKQRQCGRIVNALPTHGDDDPVEDEQQNQDVTTPAVEYNDGFDDERGDYLVLVQDHLAYRFEVQRALGRGSFGQVVECLDHRTQRQVAVKIIRNRAKYAEQAMLEVQLLTQLARADAPERSHVVRMVECFRFRNHVCIVFELLGANLYDFLKLRYFQGLEIPQIRRIGKQLAKALVALRDLDIIHCDLKPENVLIKSTPQPVTGRSLADQPINEVTLIDFGSACVQSGGAMFTYVQSRFYRSPEVILGHAYTTAVDMWSLACILVELHTGHPIFAGENEREQLTCIMEVLGVPPLPFLLKCKRRRHFFDESETVPGSSSDINPAMAMSDGPRFEPKPFFNSRGRRRHPGARALTAAAHTDDAAFLAFLAKCFVWEPDRRLTPEQALQDPWLLHAE